MAAPTAQDAALTCCRCWSQYRGCRHFPHRSCAYGHPQFQNGVDMYYRNQCHRWARGQPCKDKCTRLHMTRQQYEEIIHLTEVMVPVAKGEAPAGPGPDPGPWAAGTGPPQREESAPSLGGSQVAMASETGSLDLSPHQAGTGLLSAVLRVSALPVNDRVGALADAVASMMTLGITAVPPP